MSQGWMIVRLSSHILRCFHWHLFMASHHVDVLLHCSDATHYCTVLFGTICDWNLGFCSKSCLKAYWKLHPFGGTWICRAEELEVGKSTLKTFPLRLSHALFRWSCNCRTGTVDGWGWSSQIKQISSNFMPYLAIWNLIGLYLYLSNSFSFHQHQALRSQTLWFLCFFWDVCLVRLMLWWCTLWLTIMS